MNYLQVTLGLIALVGFLYLVSENRRKFPWKMLAIGLVSQVIMALILLKAPIISQALASLNGVVQVLESVTTKATAFMFGYLAGGPAPFESSNPANEFILAFRVLPLIIVVSAISALLYHWKILPFIIRLMAKSITALLKIRAPLGFGSASTFFIGTIEAPLLIKPYLNRMSRSDLFSLMTCTMATIAGSVMVLYSGVISQVVDNAISHMLTASFISIPAAIIISKSWIPDKVEIADATDTNIEATHTSKSSLEALIKGTMDGLDMVLKISAIIIVLFALVYLCNHVLAITIGPETTVEKILGYLFAPLMWLVGVPWADAVTAGEFMGTKVVLNEFIAYLKLSGLPSGEIQEPTRIILTYSLCGFANLASAGIIVGGLTSILPERDHEIMDLAKKSIISGNLATLLTAAIAGLLMG